MICTALAIKVPTVNIIEAVNAADAIIRHPGVASLSLRYI